MVNRNMSLRRQLRYFAVLKQKMERINNSDPYFGLAYRDKVEIKSGDHVYTRRKGRYIPK